MMNPLLNLHDLGQSYWIDNLTRQMIKSGRLRQRVEQEGLRGVTSNPTIFHKSILSGDEYNGQIHELYAAGKSTEKVYEELVTTDVRDACDILRPVYDRSSGTEGFVSLEVSPHLARDTDASISEARRLYDKVDRPNVLIKIPGTAEGVPAIEESLFSGLNINITLLFSIQSYKAVANAYMNALERRLEEDKPIDRVASVASFFLSRIDTMVDDMLYPKIDGESEAAGCDPRPQDLLGKTAIASAKLAYQSLQGFLQSERWTRLAEHGAHPQPVLWASTSTKNPKYSDVKYVEPLIGPHTVNTMPDNTIEAFAEHGKADRVTVEDDVDEARWVLDSLSCVDIDLGDVTHRLEEEGIRKFIEPYDELMVYLESKRDA